MKGCSDPLVVVALALPHLAVRVGVQVTCPYMSGDSESTDRICPLWPALGVLGAYEGHRPTHVDIPRSVRADRSMATEVPARSSFRPYYLFGQYRVTEATVLSFANARSRMNEQLREQTWAEQGQLVMPFYLICDVSYSMANDMVALNEGVRRLRRAIVAEPVVDDVAQICIMTFSDTAKVVLPMTQLSEQELPTLAVEGATNYGSAFRMLAQTVERDTANLKANGYKVYRPCAFFLTDGEPLDRDWYETFTSTLTYDSQTRTGMRSHPIIVPFGFRDAPEQVLRKLAYPLEKAKWYHSKSHDVEVALRGILDIIMNTVVSSGRSTSAGKPTLVQQTPTPGSGIAYGDPDEWI